MDTMRLKKGMRVEVCSSEDGCLGPWFEALIRSVGRNGLHCKIKYDKFVTEDGKPLVENVRVSEIRPIPPEMPLPNCSVGDAVEAYDIDCWRRGIVIKLRRPNVVLVYFPDTGTQNTYHLSSLRLGQEWVNGKWSLTLQENTQGITEGRSSTVASSRQTSVASSPGEGETDAQSHGNGEEVDKTGICEGKISSKDLKITSAVFDKKRKYRREAWPLSKCREFSDSLNGINAVKDAGDCCSSSSGKASEKAKTLIQGTNNLLAHLNAVKIGCEHEGRKKGVERGILYTQSTNAKKFRFSEPAQAADQIQIPVSNRFGCSVETCAPSILLGGSKIENNSIGFPMSITGNCMTFACASGRKDKLATKKKRTEHGTETGKNTFSDLPARQMLTTHKMELFAYRSVLQAFYAHNSLSWEREALLTNLRLELHITSDEHTQELKRLAS